MIGRTMNSNSQTTKYPCRKKLSSAEKGRISGFTLIEVLVAMAIFSIAVLGLAVGATTVMRSNKTSYFNTIGTNLAQDKMEELKAKTASSIASGSDTPSAVYGVSFSRSWTVTADQPTKGVNKIDVTVTWTDYKQNNLTISSAVKQ